MIKPLIVLFFYLFTFPLSALTVGTYNLPPFSMSEEGEHLGLVTEAVQTLLQRADITTYNLIDYPLARGLAEMRAGRIDIFYPFVADKNQEQAYILIGPIAKYNVTLFVRKDYPHEISLAALRDLILGAERGSIEGRLIQDHALHIDKASSSISCLRMVLARRISACAVGALPGQYVAAINNLSSQLRFERTNTYADMYVAVRADISPQIMANLQQAYKSLTKENYFVRQQRDYERKFALFIKTLS